MANIPSFPLPGISISHNVSIDRISLVANTNVLSPWPLGQYVFFGKNNSLWYRYTNESTPWTNDILYLGGGYQQNTKFDGNGYPATAWNDGAGNLFVQLYINGVKTVFQMPEQGTLPTVVIDLSDVFVFWVPTDYSLQLTTIKWAQLCDNFTTVHQYNAAFPGNIEMMNIQVTSTNNWMFTFEVAGTPNNKTYISFT